MKVTRLLMVLMLVLFSVSSVMAFEADDILLCKKTYSNGVSKYAFPSGSTGMCPSDWETISLQEALSGMLTETTERLTALEGSVTNLQSRVSALEGNVAGLQTTVGGLQTTIDSLGSRVIVLEDSPATCSTEVPENDYVYVTNVNSGWQIAPMEYYRADTGWFDLIRKPDGRPYSNYYYDGGFWHRDYYYKLRCATVPAALTWRYPEAMGGALIFPGIQMCE